MVASNLEQCLAQLQLLFGERYNQQLGVLKQHGNCEAFYEEMPPDAVIYPHTTEEVAAGVKVCAQYQIAVIGFGVGTSLEGHFLACQGGVCFDFSQMNQIISVSEANLDCIVQPGVTREQLNNYLRETGLMFPVDPGANATLGGMLATNASGTNAVRYGTMKDMVINLTLVMANGDIVKTAKRAKKTSAGYDLTRLMVGSEGTLGLITQATLRLFGVPETSTAGILAFNELKEAVDCVISTMQMGLNIGRIELLNADQVKVLNRYFKQSFPEQPSLWFEFSGSDDVVKNQVQQFLDLADDFNGRQILTAKSDEQRRQLWSMRHQLWSASIAYNPDTKAWTTDVCVPISALAECIKQTEADIAASGLFCPILGHVGDGNFHVLIMFDANDVSQVKKAEQLANNVVERALALDGTCSGEHGIGLGKIDKLEQELPSAIPVMKAIKQALDPQGILNPGKIFH